MREASICADRNRGGELHTRFSALEMMSLRTLGPQGNRVCVCSKLHIVRSRHVRNLADIRHPSGPASAGEPFMRGASTGSSSSSHTGSSSGRNIGMCLSYATHAMRRRRRAFAPCARFEYAHSVRCLCYRVAHCVAYARSAKRADAHSECI